MNQSSQRTHNYDELVSRDKASLDIFWLKDESLEASDNLPGPDVIAQETDKMRMGNSRDSGQVSMRNLKSEE